MKGFILITCFSSIDHTIEMWASILFDLRILNESIEQTICNMIFRKKICSCSHFAEFVLLYRSTV